MTTPSPAPPRRRGTALGPEHWDLLNTIPADQRLTGTTSALDIVAPAPEPDQLDVDHDEVAKLLAGVDQGDLDPADAVLFVDVRRWKRRKAEAEETAASMGRAIAKRTAEILELRVDRETWVNKKGEPKLPGGILGENGEILSPFVRAMIHPKFREDLETGDQYTRADVIPALVDAGLAHLIEANYDAKGLAEVIRDQVKAWRHQVGEAPQRNDAGDLIDAFGNPLTDSEAEDPTHDALGVHPALRQFIEPVTAEEIRFTVRA